MSVDDVVQGRRGTVAHDAMFIEHRALAAIAARDLRIAIIEDVSVISS